MVDSVDLNGLIRLFVNHRPVFPVSKLVSSLFRGLFVSYIVRNAGFGFERSVLVLYERRPTELTYRDNFCRRRGGAGFLHFTRVAMKVRRLTGASSPLLSTT